MIVTIPERVQRVMNNASKKDSTCFTHRQSDAYEHAKINKNHKWCMSAVKLDHT
jgi:hypothetical protein